MADEGKTDAQVLSEVTDTSFEKLEAPEVTEPEPAKPAEELKPEPALPPADKSEDDKFAWMKGLDEKTLADLKDGKLIPKHRLDEVLERSKAYESLGTPEDVSRKLADLSKKIEIAPKGAEPELTAEEKETQEVVLKLFTQLKTFSDLQKKITTLETQLEDRKKADEMIEKQENEIRDKAQAELLVQGRAKIKEYAKDLGFDSNDETTLKEIEADITARLHSNKEMTEKFYVNGEVNVLDEIFKSWKQKFFSGVQRKTEAQILKDKTKQEKLPKPPIPGGPSVPKEKKPEDMDWNELGERAVARLG